MEDFEDDGLFEGVQIDADIMDSVPSFGAESSGVIDHDEILDQAAIDKIVQMCAVSRIWFCENILDITLAPWQRTVLKWLDSGETRISIVSGNGPGKTMLCSIIADHFLLFRNGVKIPVTAPSSSQLRDGLHPECIKWIKLLPDFLRDQLDYTQDRITRNDDPENNFISFRTARKETPEALSGIHANHVLCIVDEASGVHDDVYESAQGTMSTPGSIFIMISNGTRLSGYFYNTHHRLKDLWKTLSVSSFDATTVDEQFVKTIIKTYGIDSNQYRIRVLGEFPTSEEDSLIGREYCLSAVDRDIIAPYSATRVWGLDVGRGGDNSALLKRQGDVIHGIKQWNIKDLMQTVGIVYQEWKDTKPNERPEAIYVDSIGIGAGVADRLRELLDREDTSVVDVNVSEVPAITGLYPRLRDELWYSVKSWLEGKVCSITIGGELSKSDAEELVEELSSPIAIPTSSGKNAVESKSQMKSRGVKSPNIADALCLTFAYIGSVMSGRSEATNKKWKKPIDFVPAHIH